MPPPQGESYVDKKRTYIISSFFMQHLANKVSQSTWIISSAHSTVRKKVYNEAASVKYLSRKKVCEGTSGLFLLGFCPRYYIFLLQNRISSSSSWMNLKDHLKGFLCIQGLGWFFLYFIELLFSQLYQALLKICLSSAQIPSAFA